MEQYITSDTHFSHLNIIKYSNRPFKHTDEMDEFLIDAWNKVVKPQDHVRHLGDVTMKRGGRPEQLTFIRLMKRLNGHKRLILGNHDHFLPGVYVEAGFEKIQGTGQWTGDEIIYSHFPIHPSNFGRAHACIHGHIHQQESPKPFVNEGGFRKCYINVCVEVTGYRPLHIDEVREKIREVI